MVPNIPHIQSHPLYLLSFFKAELTIFSFLDWFVSTKYIPAIDKGKPMNADIVTFTQAYLCRDSLGLWA